MSDVTHALEALRQGDPKAADHLMTLVYSELRRIAALRMANEREGHTLQPTALVHEAWIRLVENGNLHFDGRGHFFTVAAEAMRRILIEAARRKQSLKRGGGSARIEWDDSLLIEEGRPDEILAVNEALDLLAARDKNAAELVKLRYFAGMPMDEAATALNMPLRTAERLWTYAKAWLRRKISLS